MNNRKEIQKMGDGHYLPPPVPGVHLAEYLKEFHLTQSWLAKVTGIPPSKISRIIAGKRRIDVETALLLGAVFGTSYGFWMNLQIQYEMIFARRKLSARLKEVEKRSAAWRERVAKQWNDGNDKIFRANFARSR